MALSDARLVIFGARDLFDDSEIEPQQPLRRKSKTAAFMSDFRDLAVGDYVVHMEHGIAMYQGLKEIEQGEITGEYMVLEFAEAAKLYVPLTRLDLIQKYRSSEGVHPPLSRLGGTAWAKTKARVKNAMKDMADELLKLYAARKAAQGHAFPTDTQWQKEFEDAFEFNETDDQTHCHGRHQARHGIDAAHGPPALRRRGLRQDRSRHARGVQGRAGQQTSCGAGSDDGAGLPAF